ncbi:MAG: FMN-binding protein [Leptospirales bacterium]|nr:FMN-binding protein [Leptospirales bacterium]
MEHIVKPALILTLIVFFSALVLSYARKITDPYILSQEIDKQNQAVKLVLHGYTIGEELIAKLDDDTKFSYWIGTKIEDNADDADNKDGIEKNAYAFISTTHGYSGEIKSIVGVDENNKILGISIIKQSETPGLGDKVNERPDRETIRSALFGNSYSSNRETTPWFQKQFVGIDLNKKIVILKNELWTREISNELIDKNAIVAITGATVTTKSIANGIQDSLIKLKKARFIIEQDIVNLNDWITTPPQAAWQ